MATAFPTLRQWLKEEPFCLTLSSGFFGFFAHCGMLSVLETERLLPAALSGSSAGALIAGFWAAGLDSKRIEKELCRLQRSDFWDPAPGLGLLRGKLFRQHLETLLPVPSFEQCRVPVAVSVFDVLNCRTRVLKNGALAPALHASCAVPLLFHPVWQDRRPLIDGGTVDRPGLAGMPPGRRVLFHHLASRSPWRISAPQIPQRPNLTALVIGGLPRLGPFRLHLGARVLDAARRATRSALDRPVKDNVVVVD